MVALSRDGGKSGESAAESGLEFFRPVTQWLFSCIQSGDNHMTTDCMLELSRQCTQVLDALDSSNEEQQ